MIDLTMPLAATRLALAGLLAAGAVHKFRDLAGLRDTMSSYLSGTPFQGTQLVTTLAVAIAAAEAVSAIAIAASWKLPYATYGAVLGVGLFLLYAGVMVFNIARGNRIADCGCAFGGQQTQPVGPALVVRNILLALAAATVSVPVRPSALDWLGIVCFAVLLLLMYAVWNELNANRIVAGERG
jgi:hypothetical protein